MTGSATASQAARVTCARSSGSSPSRISTNPDRPAPSFTSMRSMSRPTPPPLGESGGLPLELLWGLIGAAEATGAAGPLKPGRAPKPEAPAREVGAPAAAEVGPEPAAVGPWPDGPASDRSVGREPAAFGPTATPPAATGFPDALVSTGELAACCTGAWCEATVCST